MSARPVFTLTRPPFTLDSLTAMFKFIADRDPTPEKMAQVTSLARELGAIAPGDADMLDDDADMLDESWGRPQDDARSEPRRALRTPRRCPCAARH